jgi:hypothetical protein
MTQQPETARRVADEPPPFWARWNRIYLFVFSLLLVEVIAFLLLTRWVA